LRVESGEPTRDVVLRAVDQEIRYIDPGGTAEGMVGRDLAARGGDDEFAAAWSVESRRATRAN